MVGGTAEITGIAIGVAVSAVATPAIGVAVGIGVEATMSAVAVALLYGSTDAAAYTIEAGSDAKPIEALEHATDGIWDGILSFVGE